MSAGLTARGLSQFSVGLLAAALSAAPGQAQVTFTNSDPIVIPEMGVASPYPSRITVSGYTGTITGITVTLTGLTHPFTDDLAVLFVGPGSQMPNTLLFNGAGREDPPTTSATNVNLTFDDAAEVQLPANADFGSGPYRPGLDEHTDASLAGPAPDRPYGSSFGSFLGQQPDGIYSLYIEDFVVEPLSPGTGSLSSWSITVHGITPVPEPATVLAGPALLLAALGLRRRCRSRPATGPSGG